MAFSRAARAVSAGALVALACALAPAAAHAALAHADEALTRAPYLTDLTASSVQVNWATAKQNHGVVRYGGPGDCTANSVTSTPLGNPITVNGITEYNNSVTVTGLAAGTTYCYRVYIGETAVDLLGSLASPQFTTLESPTATTPFGFAVLGDWGDTTNSGVNDGTLNANQAGVDARIAASGARFALSTGDVGYQGGTQTNYGDLNQTGLNISAVFGPDYWTVPGRSIPLHGVNGNHGQNSTFINVWPQGTSTAASGGVYSMVAYPSINGTDPASYPTAYYAFTTGGVRFYVLDASWADSNVGAATGGPCGSHCAKYQVDHDAHWTATSAQYQWLAADLAAHPGGLKVAAFHFPLRSDDASEPGDAYLENRPGTSGTLEQLLHDNGVNLVFNGHAHDYQRNIAPPGGVPSYVSGGGGGRASTVGGHGCASTDAYAIGWSYSKNKGSKCGAAPAPTSDTQIYHFLNVTVNGSSITVAPTDSRGNTFDVQTYNFGPDGTPPSAPSSLAYSRSGSTEIVLSWSAATDNNGVHAYDVYRNGIYLATTPATVTGYTDATAIAGQGYTYQVVARDLAGNTAFAGITVSGGGNDDTTPPTPSTSLNASATGPTGIALSWAASTDNVGVTSYAILRSGVSVATVGGTTTSWSDTGLTPSTAYTYQVVAYDAAGNASAASTAVTVTTQADLSAPTTPGTPTATGIGSSQVTLSWTASTDNVGVLRYDVLRNGSVVGTASGTTFTDMTVAAATTYTYAVRALDAAGNNSTSGGLTVTTLTPGSLFYDGFESGGLSQWGTASGLTTTASVVHTGGYAARETSSGSATYAYASLPGSYTELWTQVWVYVASRSTSANLFGYRSSSGASIVNLYLDTSGRISLRNNIGNVTTYSTATVGAGGWHRFVLHANVNGTSSSVNVSMDGTAAPNLTLTGQNFGTNPITKLQLGETATGRTYDIVFDDVTVSQSGV